VRGDGRFALALAWNNLADHGLIGLSALRSGLTLTARCTSVGLLNIELRLVRREVNDLLVMSTFDHQERDHQPQDREEAGACRRLRQG